MNCLWYLLLPYMLANGLVITVRVACFYEKCCFVRNEFDVVEYKDASVDR